MNNIDSITKLLQAIISYMFKLLSAVFSRILINILIVGRQKMFSI